MTRGIAPGVLCIVIKSEAGNEGREVTAIRPVRKGQVARKLGPGTTCTVDGWLVEAPHPLRSFFGDRHACFAAFPASWLLPLHPGDDAQDITTDTPADAVAA